MSVVIPDVVAGLMVADSMVEEAQATPDFPVHHGIDEYSVLFGQRVDQDYFVARASSSGLQKFNESNDFMGRMDDLKDVGFGVHFDFLSFPNRPWRVECMSVSPPGSAPLHEAATGGNPNYVGIFHASYKLPDLDAYLVELERLRDGGFEMSAEYRNTYGRFSYWEIEPHLPYFKPRVNLRDPS
jgi:hypothetical protein